MNTWLYLCLSSFPTYPRLRKHRPCPPGRQPSYGQLHCRRRSGLVARTDECAVREFGRLAEIDGKETWYALYSNFPEPMVKLPERLHWTLQMFWCFSRLQAAETVSYLSASVMRRAAITPSTMLHSSCRRSRINPVYKGSGAGDGRGQFQNDAYLLWQEQLWVELMLRLDPASCRKVGPRLSTRWNLQGAVRSDKHALRRSRPAR